jgi:hypothetical protein
VRIVCGWNDYRHEPRCGDEVVSDRPSQYRASLEVGDRIEIGGQPGDREAVTVAWRSRRTARAVKKR